MAVTPEIFCMGTYGYDLVVIDPKCSADERAADRNGSIDAAFAEAEVKACVARLQAGLQQKRVTVDPAGGLKCLTAKLAQPRSARWPEPITSASCNGYITGLQKKGDRCRESWECAPHLSCVGFEALADGTCQDAPTAKAACGTTKELATFDLELGERRDCAPGFICKSAVCEPLIAAGEACYHDYDCADGLACRAMKCTADVSQVARGKACGQVGGECAAGLYCDGGTPGLTLGKCVDRKPAGKPCEYDVECKGRCRASAGAKRCEAHCQSG
jgi:hypothetical protein